jgi:protein-S-isoprenylcysteine O-methyltransferase Ste14
MLSPTGWVPRRLPIWGALLGILAALMAVFALNLPSRVLGVALPTTARALTVLVAALLYYLLWIVVRIVYKSLSASSSAP